MNNPTTRRHPRTLAEAFPDERAYAIERPRRRIGDVVADCIFAVALGLVGAMVLAHNL